MIRWLNSYAACLALICCASFAADAAKVPDLTSDQQKQIDALVIDKVLNIGAQGKRLAAFGPAAVPYVIKKALAEGRDGENMLRMVGAAQTSAAAEALAKLLDPKDERRLITVCEALALCGSAATAQIPRLADLAANPPGERTVDRDMIAKLARYAIAKIKR
jgi:hypothetical protein